MGDTQANQRKKTRGEDYIAQGSILAVAVVITKIIGVVYRIPVSYTHLDVYKRQARI